MSKYLNTPTDKDLKLAEDFKDRFIDYYYHNVNGFPGVSIQSYLMNIDDDDMFRFLLYFIHDNYLYQLDDIEYLYELFYGRRLIGLEETLKRSSESSIYKVDNLIKVQELLYFLILHQKISIYKEANKYSIKQQSREVNKYYLPLINSKRENIDYVNLAVSTMTQPFHILIKELINSGRSIYYFNKSIGKNELLTLNIFDSLDNNHDFRFLLKIITYNLIFDVKDKPMLKALTDMLNENSHNTDYYTPNGELSSLNSFKRCALIISSLIKLAKLLEFENDLIETMEQILNFITSINQEKVIVDPKFTMNIPPSDFMYLTRSPIRQAPQYIEDDIESDDAETNDAETNAETDEYYQ